MAAGLARRCLVQISYAIGVAQPLSVHVDTYGTGTKPDKNILALVLKNFDFRPGETCPRPLRTAFEDLCSWLWAQCVELFMVRMQLVR